MSFPILLQGKLLGVDGYLTSPVQGASDEVAILGRARWVTALIEVLPRALLADLGLAPVLLGSSGGGQFLLVLPLEIRQKAEDFLAGAASQVALISEQRLSLVWSWTEHLGAWPDILKRLQDGLAKKVTTPTADFTPFATHEHETPSFPSESLAVVLTDATQLSWSPENPAHVSLTGGKHSWSLKSDLRIARHTAAGDVETVPATTEEFARRATGMQTWGVLRGDVDHFDIRLRRAQSDMEYLQLALSYQSFFAEELEMLCSQPDYRRKVSILYCGSGEFSVYGSWDALVGFGREVQRLFHRFADANLKDLPGAEGKTITMAVTFANDADNTLASIYQQSTDDLRKAKCQHKDSIHILGRTLEWKHLADANDLKENLVKLIDEFDVPASSIRELQGMYRDTQSAGGRARRQRVDRPWRYIRRINRVLESTGRKDFQKLRRNIVADLVGRNQNNVKLRPSGRVALEWARLATEADTK